MTYCQGVSQVVQCPPVPILPLGVKIPILKFFSPDSTHVLTPTPTLKGKITGMNQLAHE